MLSEFKSFLLFDRGVERVTFSHRARSVFTVTLQFDFLLIVGIRTVVAAVCLQGRYLASALLMRTFVLTAYICYLSHDTPPLSEVKHTIHEENTNAMKADLGQMKPGHGRALRRPEGKITY